MEREYVTTRRVWLVSNVLQGGCQLQLISVKPPVEGGPEGLLVVRCPTAENYWEIRRFLDEERGSVLQAPGAPCHVHRLEDDGEPERPFPQHIRFVVAWRHR